MEEGLGPHFDDDMGVEKEKMKMGQAKAKEFWKALKGLLACGLVSL